MKTLHQVSQTITQLWALYRPSLSSDQVLREVRRFIQDVLEITPLQWIEYLQQPCDREKELMELCLRVLQDHYPLSRLKKRRFFWKHSFQLNEATLDPRYESEGIISLVLQYFQSSRDLINEGSKAHLSGRQPSRILDIGTGTGCLLISLLNEYPKATGVGIDASPLALEAAQLNACTMGVKARSQWIESYWLSNVQGIFDCIVSNPPYVENHAYLPPEVRLWDPPLALYGGKDGLDAYRHLALGLLSHLAPKGLIVLEIGDTQGPAVCDILRSAMIPFMQVVPDLAGKDRYIMACREPFDRQFYV